MKTMTIRMPDSLVSDIERESRVRKISRSDVVRERLSQPRRKAEEQGTMRDLISDLIGSVKGLPADLSSNKKKYLPALIRAKKNYIADSSVLVALLNPGDGHQDWIVAQAGCLPWPWQTCEPVLTEAFYLLGTRGAPKLRKMLRKGALSLSFDLKRHLEQVLALMDKYADVPMSLADACLVRMSEILPDPQVLTTDSDFRIYRRHSRMVVPCLMP